MWDRAVTTIREITCYEIFSYITKKMQCGQQQYILIFVSVLFISVKYYLF
jgi:hypothetical protein